MGLQRHPLRTMVACARSVPAVRRSTVARVLAGRAALQSARAAPAEQRLQRHRLGRGGAPAVRSRSARVRAAVGQHVAQGERTLRQPAWWTTLQWVVRKLCSKDPASSRGQPATQGTENAPLAAGTAGSRAVRWMCLLTASSCRARHSGVAMIFASLSSLSAKSCARSSGSMPTGS